MDDFDKAIEDILLSEDKCAQQAYADGLKSGYEIGYNEGYPHGYKKGAQIASEIVTYKGFALAWLSYFKHTTDDGSPTKNERQLQTLSKLIEMVDEFPKENLEDDIERKLLELRNKFKQVCSLLKVSYKDLVPPTVIPDESF